MKDNSVLIFIEINDGKINRVVYQLLNKALQLGASKIYGICIASNLIDIEEELAYLPFDKVVFYEGFKEFNSSVFSECFVDGVEKLSPSIALLGATPIGKATAALSSAKLKTGLTADCTELEIDDDDKLIQIRPAFGGDVIAEIITEKTFPQMATIKVNTFEEYETDRKLNLNIIKGNIEIKNSYDIIDTKYKKSEKKISDYDVVVVVGNAIKDKKDIDKFNDFAEKIGGTLASTRALVERGIMPPSKQVGLSGNYINPKVLITFGVSGSIQFISGIRNVETMIAINNDKESRIFDIAHYSILADIYELIDIL